MRIHPCWFALLLSLAGLGAGPVGAQDAALRQLAQRVTDGQPAQPSRLAHYLRCFQDATFQDSRIFAFQVTALPQGQQSVRLTGYIEFAEIQSALSAYLQLLGFTNVDDQTVLLPSPQLGTGRYGFVQTSHTLVLTQPDPHAETATDALLGEPLQLLLALDGYLLCHTAEGYLGFVAAQHVQRVDADAFEQQLAGRHARLLEDVHVAGNQLPAGACLPCAGTTPLHALLQLPGGPRVAVPRNAVLMLPLAPDPKLEQVLQLAESFLGTPYLWGGKTRQGIDCSGLVQTSFATCGIPLPRDANQQLLAGRLTATRWYRAGLRRGDTLYFLGASGRISHTGIYLGKDQFIEAVRPHVCVSSLNPRDANYSPRADNTLAFGKRLVD